MNTFRICIPTYKRKNPRCLKLLDKLTVPIYLYVRHDDYENGFYNHLKHKNIVFKLLSSSVSNLGETRQEILESCHNDNIDYCVMLDDTVFDILNINTDMSIEDIIYDAIYRMKTDERSQYVVDFTFSKYAALDNDDNIVILNRSFLSDEKYFKVLPWQCHMFDVKKIINHDIKYESSTNGFEDLLFFGRILQAGLLCIGYNDISFSAEYGNTLKKGGSHSTEMTYTDLQKKYYKMSKQVVDTLQLDGLTLETRYRRYIGCTLTTCEWDLDFFREVLVYKRDLNKETILHKLSSKNFIDDVNKVCTFE